MDIAGLAFGVAALAGVLEGFVTILARIDAARSMKKDYDTLVLKLDIQRALLDNLINEVRLADPKKNDKCVDGPDNKDLVIRSIERVRSLLEDGERLQQRYGIKPDKFQEALQSTEVPSNRSMHSFYKMSQKIRSLRNVRRSQPDQSTQSNQHESKSQKNKHSGIQKITWATKDKEQFEYLGRNVAEFIQLIYLLTLPSTSASASALQSTENEKLGSSHGLEIVENVPSKKENDVSSGVPVTIAPERAKRVLDRLWFRFIDDRRNHIEEAHAKTFKWATRNPAPESKWDNLRRWLRSGNDIYWIAGKPGSGKSTLMKYLYGHPKVSELLEKWAGNRKLTMASFFLWNVGTSEQNTQHGLARGLLHQILKKNQSLIPVILPGMWLEAQDDDTDVKPPSSTELHQAFQRLGRESTEGVFAFFIDGIDELTGNYREAISFIQKLATSARIKVLLSSREINECNTAFSTKPKMRLQDLTKKDIEQYVNSTVRSHLSRPNTSQLSERDIHALVMSLQQKAQGVFLWVVLACRTLLDHFDACDKAKELQTVVDELPPELEDLFRGMLESVPRAYQQEAAKLLRICYTHVSHSETCEHAIATFSLAWAYEKDMALEKMHDFTRYSVDEIKQQCTTFEVRLRSLCKGLLEVNGDFSRDYPYKLTGGPSYVEFMHRTVFEYLGSTAALEMDCLKIHDEAFDPVAAFAYIHAYEIYLRKEPVFFGDEWWLDSLFNPLRLVSKLSPAKLPQVLDKFALALMEPRNLCRLGTAALSNRFLPACLAGNSNDTVEKFFGYSQHELSREHAALLLAVELHLYDFVRDFDIVGFNTLQILQYPHETERRNLLFHAFAQPMMSSMNRDFDTWFFSPRMIETLLDSGCDPNQIIVRQEYGGWDPITTPWHTWLSWLYDDSCVEKIDRVSKAASVTAKMLKAGADLCPEIFTSLGDLRLHLLVKVVDWVIAIQEIESKQQFLQIIESCMMIFEAIRSSINENPLISEHEDPDSLKESPLQLVNIVAAFLEEVRPSINENSAVLQKNDKGMEDKRDEEDKDDSE